MENPLHKLLHSSWGIELRTKIHGIFHMFKLKVSSMAILFIVAFIQWCVKQKWLKRNILHFKLKQKQLLSDFTERKSERKAIIMKCHKNKVVEKESSKKENYAVKVFKPIQVEQVFKYGSMSLNWSPWRILCGTEISGRTLSTVSRIMP